METNHNETSSTISSDGAFVEFIGKNGQKERFHAAWLRHMCECPVCCDQSCYQRKFDLADLCPSYSVKSAHIKDDKLHLGWNEDGHSGFVTLDFLDKHSCRQEAVDRRLNERIPTVCKGPVPRISYQDVLKSEESLWRWLKYLNEEGLCIVEDIPPDVTVKQITGLIWDPPQTTIYGEIFHVESHPDPVNIAYTPVAIAGHMDLTYYDTIPGYQFLLCKRFDCCITGGENTTVDAWYEAERMRKLYPEDFATLTRVPATFYYRGQDMILMRLTRPHITVDNYTGQIDTVRWGPLAEGPLSVKEQDVAPYYRAQNRLAQMLRNSDSKSEFRLEEGQMLSFNNRRIVHSRNSFQLNGGHRLLEGCYINIDEMKSKAQVLSNKYNGGKLVKYVF